MIVDEASIKITPDTSGFAAELRAELEAEIAAATAGLDDVIHVRVEVDADAARGRLQQALDDFGNDGSQAFRRLRDEQQDLFDDIRVNTEKARDKTVLEVTKTRDRINQRLAPFWAKLKLQQKTVKTDFDKIKKSAEDAGRAAVNAFSGSNAARSEAALTQARVRAEQAAERLSAAEARLNALRETAETRSRALDAAEQALTAARDNARETTFDLGVAERALQITREQSDATTEDIREGERDVAQARKEADAAAKAATTAENALNRAREQATTAAERVVVSEGRISDLRRQLIAANDQVATSERRFRAALEETSRSADRSGNVVQRLGDRVRDSGDRGTVAGAAFRALGSTISAVGRVGGLFTSVLTNISDSVGNMAGKSLPNLAAALLQAGAQLTAFGAIAGAVSFIVGAVGAALAGIPALAMGAAAAIAAVALGMEGIKRAYESSLKPALDQLGVQVSQVFEQKLTPAFQRLSTQLIPQITESMKTLGGAIADVGVDLINMVTQGENVRKINDIITNMAGAVRGQLSPALQNIVQRFIDIGAQRPVMDAMVGVIGDLINNTANWLAEMDRIKLLQPAVQALRTSLSNLEQGFFQILTAATQFFTQAAPGFDRLVDSVSNVASSLLSDLGPAFGQVMDAAGQMLDSVPPSVWDGLKQSIRNVADALTNFANSGAFTQIVEGVTDIVNAFAGFVNVVSVIARVTGAIRDLAGGAGAANPDVRNLADAINENIPGSQQLDDFMRSLGVTFGETGDAAGQAGPQILDEFGRPIQQLPGVVQPPVNATATAIEESMRRAQQAAETGGQGVADGVTTPLPAMQQTAQVSFDTLPPVVRDAMVGAEAAATTGSNLIRDAVRNGFDTAAQAATDAMTRLRDTVQQGFNNATNVATSAMRGLQTEVTGAFQNMASVVQTNMTNIQTTVQTGTQAIATAFSTMATGIQSSATAAATAMQNAGTAATTMQTTMSTAFQQTGTAATTMATTVQTAMTTMATAVGQSMQQVTQSVQQAMQQATQAVQQGAQQMVQAIQQGAQQMVQAVQQGMQQLVTAVRTGGQQAVSAAQQAAQQIVQAFRSQLGAMEAAGRAMMERLAAGIRAGTNSAVAAARSAAAAIRAQFPSSPAKEGPLSGRGDPLISGGVISQRLAAGITANLALIRSSTAQVAAAVAGGLSGRTVNLPAMTSSAGSVSSFPGLDIFDLLRRFRTPIPGPVTPSRPPTPTPAPQNAPADRLENGLNPDILRRALSGLTFRIEDDGRGGLARVVNRQNRQRSQL